MESMNSHTKLSYAIAAILSGSGAGFVTHAATVTADSSSDAIEEITVTAQRRTESIQDVPITIQALTSETLSQLNVTTLDDFVKYLPNVSTSNLGPGQGSIYMRGLSVGALGTQGTGSVGNFPNVAVYLDEQSVQIPGRNLDVYAADMERIEVLEGPQGTLFGAGAQAGVVRYITNKPKLDVTEGSVSAGYGDTAHGDPNTDVNAMINLPLIDNTLAIRGVIYSDARGGYINNPAGQTFTRSGYDLGICENNGGVFNSFSGTCTSPGHVPTNSVVASTNNVAGSAINPLTYQGLRLSALWKINDSWNALVTQTYQEMNAQGVFYEMPTSSDGQALPPLTVSLFSPSYDKDQFENTALTIDGKLGDLKLVYAGAYLVRNVHQQQDYTNYARGVYGPYYQCVGFSKTSTSGANGQCYSPVANWTDTERNTHLTQEMRLSTPDDWRLRGLVGIFYEDFKVNDLNSWNYKTVPTCTSAAETGCFVNIGPIPGAFTNPLNITDNTGFIDDFERKINQRAIFGSIDFDIIPKVLTITGGARYFDIDNEILGQNVFSFYCEQYGTSVVPNPCHQYSTNIGAQIPHSSKATGTRSRGNLSWKVTEDALVYYTFSQGFRPGGFNRGSTVALGGQYATPYLYGSDSLTNNEVGWKTEWLGHRLQFNGTVYQEKWNEVQTGIFDPQQGYGNLTFGLNGPSYKVNGVETQIVARLLPGLTVTGSASWNSSSESKTLALTGINGQAITNAPNPFLPQGSHLAFSPPFEGNLRARYEWTFADYHPFVQFGAVHQSQSQTATSLIELYELPSWTTYDGALGIGKDNWTVQAVGSNLTDVNKSLFTSGAQFIETQTPMRPRVLTLRFSYKFSGSK
jgi:outer membrane receptor protein involved in Fe transport